MKKGVSGRQMVRALRHRNYRLFFCGQGVSLVGTWLTRTAMSWLVYKLSHSGVTLGAVSFAGLLPVFLFTPVAGVLVDRWNKHRVLVGTQVAALLQSAALAALTLSGHITVAYILVLSVVQGFINAFDFPVRQSFVIQMIDDPEDLPNAIALNSSIVNLARLLGPACAGALIATIGEGGCFAIDAVSYLAVIATLLMMNIPLPAAKPKGGLSTVLAGLKEGLLYAGKSREIVSVLGLFALVSFMGVPYLTLLPMIVSERLAGDARVLGYLTAASGCGAFGGALFLSARKTVLGFERIIAIAAVAFGVGLLFFGVSHGLPLSMLAMVVAGMGMMVQMAASNTVLQMLVEEDKRGRVLSLFATAYAGMSPFGSLVGGFVAERIGASVTLEYGGAICCLGGVVFYAARMRSQKSALTF